MEEAFQPEHTHPSLRRGLYEMCGRYLFYPVQNARHSKVQRLAWRKAEFLCWLSALWLGPHPSPFWVSVCFSEEWQMGGRFTHTTPSPSPPLGPRPSPSLSGPLCRYQSLLASCGSWSERPWPIASSCQNFYMGQVREQPPGERVELACTWLYIPWYPFPPSLCWLYF